MNNEDKKIKMRKSLLAIGIIIVLLVLFTALGGEGLGGGLHSLVPTGWFGPSLSGGQQLGYGDAVITYRGADESKIYTEVLFMPNEDDSYTYAEAVFPESAWPDKGDTEVPLVLMAHGFSGTLNSGGAAELASRFARAGIATIRVDFDHRVRTDKKAAKTSLYDLSTMQEDMVKAMEYMVNTYSIDENRIGLYARSMGGRVAMTMANESAGGVQYAAMALVAPAGNASAMTYYMGGQSKWDALKEEASASGFVEKQGQKLTPEWFALFEEYNPCEHADSFSNPVLVIYNTLDNVVLPETSLECAAAYLNSQTIEVTTTDGHGYEMGLSESSLKDELMTEIVSFMKANL